MTTLLNVQSSPNIVNSASRAVSQTFIESYIADNPDTDVIDVDLIKSQPSHVGTEHLGAFFTPPANQALGSGRCGFGCL